MRKTVSFLLGVTFLAFVWSLDGYCLKEPTHEEINQYVAKNTINGFSLDNYLKNNLGFSKGVEDLLYGYSEMNKKYDSYKIRVWIGEGGNDEDTPEAEYADAFFHLDLNRPARSNNHFHNPLATTWETAGLNDKIIWQLITRQSITGQSSILWAQNTLQGVGGFWSWLDARRYFYLALTGKDIYSAWAAKTEAERNKYYASTFRAVGQQMHIIQDSSVPGHVRNDAHPEESLRYGMGYGYETTVERYRSSPATSAERLKWNSWLANPIPYNLSLLNSPYTYANAPVPISWLIDSNIYDGSNPSITSLLASSTDTGIMPGLSEYTNANFLSQHTKFSDNLSPDDRHYFPYPKGTNAVIWTDSAAKSDYFKKTGDGDAVDHLARGGMLVGWRSRYFPQEKRWMNIALDDRCYEEYASKLIPRAVGYSASLLNYFFRGTIEVSPPDQYVYSIIDGSGSSQQFTKIKVKIKNTTPNEAMGAGTITAVAKYKKRKDYQPDLSNDPPDWDSMDSDYSYSVSGEQAISSLSSTTPQEFPFDFATGPPIPAGITDLSLQVIFKGTLGNEKDSAIAVGFKDLMEPTHLVIWNLTDRFSILDSRDSMYHLHTGDEIRNVKELWDLAKSPPAAVIDPYDINYEIAFTGSASPTIPPVTSASVTLHGGNYARIIVLADNPTNAVQRSLNYLKLTTTNTIDNTTDSSIAPFSAAYNQTAPSEWGDIFQYTDIETFRTITQHYHYGYLRCRPLAHDSAGQPVCPYNESEVTTPPNLAPTEAVITY